MVIVRQWAGLGNQMFIHAYCRALECKGIDVKIDTSYYDTMTAYGGNKFGLPKVFPGIQLNYANDRECNSKAIYKMNYISRFLRKIGINKSTYISQTKTYNDCGYCPELLLIDNKYIEGYFQSGSYFESISDVIYNDFTFDIKTPYPNNFLMRIKSVENPISLHIRRGDYVSGGAQKALCETDYYYNAISYIKNKLGDVTFFVFSDDIPWCEAYFSRFNDEFVFVKDQPAAYYDMYLMTQCRHNIIADSTFSWWGAWLNRSTDKIVLAPDEWLQGSYYSFTNIIPADWVKIKRES